MKTPIGREMRSFWQSQTARLTMFYLMIIMAMSIAFSITLYFVLAGQLERQVPKELILNNNYGLDAIATLQEYLAAQVDVGRRELIIRLVFLNSIMLLFGAAISYLLARKTLEPIERNVEAQAQFVSDASHELRTPLTALQIENEVALRNPKLKIKDAKQILQNNLDEVERLRRMTSLMLEATSGSMSLEVQPTDLEEIIDKALAIVAPVAAENQVEIINNAKPAKVTVDSDAIVQALTALIENAVKYSSPDAPVEITSFKRLQFVTLAVSDQGPGIESSQIDRIFDRFYRADSARTRQYRGGHGLGLSIVRTIMRAHGSDVRCKSKLGKGSTFELILPRS